MTTQPKGAVEAMAVAPVHLNLLLAWVWITAGFLVGFWFGLHFHREDWLGGYASLRRRMYRLGHISFFGLAIINLLFYFTARTLPQPGAGLAGASWGFLVGAVAMPACCFLMAHNERWRPLFLVPVLSLVGAGALTVWEVARL